TDVGVEAVLVADLQVVVRVAPVILDAAVGVTVAATPLLRPGVHPGRLIVVRAIFPKIIGEPARPGHTHPDPAPDHLVFNGLLYFRILLLDALHVLMRVHVRVGAGIPPWAVVRLSAAQTLALTLLRRVNS